MQYMILPTNQDLFHHGIKDQKWGVRNGPPYPLNKGKKFKNRHTYEGLKKQEQNMNKPHYLKKGTKIYRTTSSKNEDNTGSAYVSYTEVDRGIYKEWVRMTEAKSGKKSYEKTFKVTSDLKICGTDDVKEVFSKVIDKIGKQSIDTAAKEFVIGDRVKNKDINQAEKDFKESEIFTKSVDKVYSGEAKFDNSNSSSYVIVDKTTNNKIAEIAVDTYSNGIAYKRAKQLLDCINEKYNTGKITDFEYGIATLTKNSSLKNEMIKELKSRGYDAMPDLAGAGIMPTMTGKGYLREGVEPLIIFDRSKSLKEIKTKEVNELDSHRSYVNSNRALSYLGDRKRG